MLGLEVLAASRVHNRALRDVFDARVAQLTAAQARPDTDPYLPLPTPGASELLLAVLQQPGELAEGRALQLARLGFAAAAGQAPGEPGPVLLSNCVNVADAARVQHAAGSRAGSAGQQQQQQDPARGVLLVCKAYLAKPVDQGCSFATPPGIRASSAPQAASGGAPMPAPGAHPGSTAVHSAKASDARQKLWHCLTPALVLPEYVVEFRYTLAPESPLHRAPAFPAVSEHAAAQISEQLRQGPDALMGAVAQPLAGWLAAARDAACLLRTPPERQLDGSCQAALTAASSAVQQAVNSFGASASAGIAACQQLQALATPALAAYLCTQQLGAVSHLDLHGLGLQELAPLQGLPALEALLLSCNRLSSVQALASLSTLTQLDLSFNHLTSSSPGLAALLWLPHLAELDLGGNQLAAAEPWLQAASLAPSLALGRGLQRLDLRGNAATAVKGHRSLLLQHLLALRWLDGSEVVPGGCQGAGPLQRHCYTAQGAPVASACSSGSGEGGGEGWQQQVAAVLMGQCSLRSLPGQLAQLPALSRASFADNHLQSVAGLQGCTALRDVCLAHNSLAGLSQLASLPGLLKLDVAHNQISCLEPLAALTALEQVRRPASPARLPQVLVPRTGRSQPTCCRPLYPRAAVGRGGQRGRELGRAGGADQSAGVVRRRQPACRHAAGEAAQVGDVPRGLGHARGRPAGSSEHAGSARCHPPSRLGAPPPGPAAGSCPAC